MLELFLKILSGNHRGAEIPLRPGTYSLGKDEQCDLVLTDSSLHDRELTIDIDEHGHITIKIDSQAGSLSIDGAPVNSPSPLPHFRVAASDEFFFALGPADAHWPKLLLPEPGRVGDDDGTESDTTDDTVSDNLANDADQQNQNDPETETSDSPINTAPVVQAIDTQQADHNTEIDQDAPSIRIGKRWLIGIPTGLLALLVALVVTLVSSSPDQPPSGEPIQLDQANRIRNELELRNVRLQQLPEQSILIDGYVATLEEKQSIQRAFSEQAIPFTSRLVVTEEILANARSLLKNRGYKHLKLESDNSPGSLIMTGYIPSSEELDEATNALKQEIHGLVSVTDQVENQTTRLDTLKSMLREKGLIPRVHLSQKSQRIILQGYLLDNQQTYNLNDVVSRFRKRYADQPELVLATKTVGTTADADDPSAVPALGIKSVSMGKVPFITMKNGDKFLKGAKFSNGYVIEEINIEYLLLSKDNNRIKYRLGGNRDQQPDPKP